MVTHASTLLSAHQLKIRLCHHGRCAGSRMSSFIDSPNHYRGAVIGIPLCCTWTHSSQRCNPLRIPGPSRNRETIETPSPEQSANGKYCMAIWCTLQLGRAPATCITGRLHCCVPCSALFRYQRLQSVSHLHIGPS
jgi:hypothetical protein